jgi:hypothetical protein
LARVKETQYSFLSNNLTRTHCRAIITFTIKFLTHKKDKANRFVILNYRKNIYISISMRKIKLRIN